MSSACSKRHTVACAIAALMILALPGSVRAVVAAPSRSALRVCADPNNMPFSNARGEGFENHIAALVAEDLHVPLRYFWLPQRRGFVRNSLDAGQCDVVIGVPAQYGRVQTTRGYYRSVYVFVSRKGRHLSIDSFDAPALKSLSIGIQISGDDYDNPPAAQALARRGLFENVRGFTIYGDYLRPDPQREIVDAVADGRVDIAVVWGPLAGYYARLEPTPIQVTPIAADRDDPSLVFAFDIAMGVRRGDMARRNALDAVIARRGADIQHILRSYGVPLR